MARKFLVGIDMSGQKVTGLADGTAATDAVTLQQLQAFVRGLSWKDEVRAASTTNVTLATPGATLDGVTLVSGDRVLLKDQSTGSQNGIYVWTGASSALTRAADADSAAELIGATTLVTEGTANGDKAFVMNTDNVTLGSTSLTWAQFGGGGAAYTAGNGLQLTGSSFAVLLDTNSGLLVSGTGLKVDSTVVRKFAATIGDGSATSIAVTHNLGTQDVEVQLQDATTRALVDTDWVATSVNVVTFTFAAAPASNAYRAIVQG